MSVPLQDSDHSRSSRRLPWLAFVTAAATGVVALAWNDLDNPHHLKAF